MKFFPESTLTQIEFDKIIVLLENFCRTELSKQKALQIRIHTRIDYIQKELNETNECKQILDAGDYFPCDFTQPLSKELKLLSIQGSTLSGLQCIQIKKLTENIAQLFRWFNAERRIQFPYLAELTGGIYFEKKIIELIDEILEENGTVKDKASDTLFEIRMSLHRKRNELRKVFDRIAAKWNKQGYLTDIEESFMNGRRVLAVFAENKRMIKGVLHAESDSRRTCFIEPEETTFLNNEIFSLEHEETNEMNRILKALTQKLHIYAPLLIQYIELIATYDFIRAKARLAQEMRAQLPKMVDKAQVHLLNAYHPLLLLHNEKLNKPTIPVHLILNESQRILVISGPNAGGKTVTMKTTGLLQVMVQSGLLVPVSPDSEMGVFKQLFIHIGDTQSIEYELSTYSAHLTHLKHFMEFANGKTLFFIDELGSGTDPNLGGAFAEVIMEEFARKHSIGIVTTHYLNLKIMANKVKGIINGAMQFDEKKLTPLYTLKIGTPGSSYTFSIAERIGLDRKLIDRARKLVDQQQYQLERLLNQTEQHFQELAREKKTLDKLLKENEQLKKQMQATIHREQHRQEMERLKLSNQQTEQRLIQLKEMDRKLKSLVIQWRKSENKEEVVKLIQSTLFQQKEKFQSEKKQNSLSEKYEELSEPIEVGVMVKMRNNRQIGVVKEIRGKKAIIQVGQIPITVALQDLLVIRAKTQAD